jgi:chaperonin GroEL (HSP60 family)
LLSRYCSPTSTSTKAAVEEGIVPGGNIALLRAVGAVEKVVAEGDVRGEGSMG